MATVKIIELIGTSPDSWQDAAKAAVKEASKTIRNIHGVDVTGQTAKIENGEIVEYRVNLKLAFEVEKERNIKVREGKVA
jgi:flavin-binding protein dodecin